MRRLIVNADDYGRTAGVSRGILETHRDGIVTSTTIMINLPGAGGYLADALAHPDLGVGLHLTFTGGRGARPGRRGRRLQAQPLLAVLAENSHSLEDQLASQHNSVG